MNDLQTVAFIFTCRFISFVTPFISRTECDSKHKSKILCSTDSYLTHDGVIVATAKLLNNVFESRLYFVAVFNTANAIANIFDRNNYSLRRTLDKRWKIANDWFDSTYILRKKKIFCLLIVLNNKFPTNVGNPFGTQFDWLLKNTRFGGAWQLSRLETRRKKKKQIVLCCVPNKCQMFNSVVNNERGESVGATNVYSAHLQLRTERSHKIRVN